MGEGTEEEGERGRDGEEMMSSKQSVPAKRGGERGKWAGRQEGEEGGKEGWRMGGRKGGRGEKTYLNLNVPNRQARPWPIPP